MSLQFPSINQTSETFLLYKDGETDYTRNQLLLPSLFPESTSIRVRGQPAEDPKDVCRPGHTYRDEKDNGHLNRTSEQEIGEQEDLLAPKIGFLNFSEFIAHDFACELPRREMNETVNENGVGSCDQVL